MWYNRGIPFAAADLAVGPGTAPEGYFRKNGKLQLHPDGSSDLSECRISGNIFYDGSCANRHDPVLSRAAWGIVEVDENGNTLATFSGNVPRSMPQTPQSAEHLAHAFAVQHLEGESILTGDCKGVVKDANDPSRKPLGRKRMHAAATHAVRCSDKQHFVKHDRWTKAHVLDGIAKLAKQPQKQQAAIAALTSQQNFDALANCEADKVAKAALEEDISCQRDEHVFATHASCYARTKAIARVIATMLQQWPSNTEQGKRHVRKAAVKRKVEATPTLGLGHWWNYRSGDGSICRHCLAVKRDAMQPTKQSLATCPGFSAKFSDIVANPREHMLVMLDCTEHPTLFCLACHHYADTGNQGILADKTKMCPRNKGPSWEKKNQYVGTRVFRHRLPPNPNRANERVHGVIPIDDDPRVYAQLRHSQETYEAWRAVAVDRMTGGPQTAIQSDAPTMHVEPNGRARGRRGAVATIPLIDAVEWMAFGGRDLPGPDRCSDWPPPLPTLGTPANRGVLDNAHLYTRSPMSARTW
jgi:hypothetical protein